MIIRSSCDYPCEAPRNCNYNPLHDITNVLKNPYLRNMLTWTIHTISYSGEVVHPASPHRFPKILPMWFTEDNLIFIFLLQMYYRIIHRVMRTVFALILNWESRVDDEINLFANVLFIFLFVYFRCF